VKDALSRLQKHRELRDDSRKGECAKGVRREVLVLSTMLCQTATMNVSLQEENACVVGATN
jgi:hypothetical protein